MQRCLMLTSPSQSHAAPGGAAGVRVEIQQRRGPVVDETATTNRPAGEWRRRLVRLLLWLVGAWVLPFAAQALQVDFVLPVAILALTAALLRGGRTLLDRLMLALLVLLGAVAGAGLLFTFWPWGLAPVPVAGCAISTLALVHVLGKRKLHLPRAALSDGVILIGSVAVAAYFARPFLRTDHTGKLGLLLIGEDNSRHFGLFDTIRSLGGYLFWQPSANMPNVFGKLNVYPQGWHLTAALLDGFARSSTEVGDAASAADHYVAFTIATYVLFASTVLWAARWIAGPALASWRVLPVTVFLVGVLTFGELPLMMTTYGFVSEVFGLTLLAGMVAVIARSPGGRNGQALLLAASLMSIGFAYQLFLPPTAIAVVGWLALNRRHWRKLIPVAAMLAIVMALAAIPTLLGFLYGNSGGTISATGAVNTASRSEAIATTALVAAALLTPPARRLRVWRSYRMALLSIACLPVAFRLYLFVIGSGANYYFEKTLTAFSVALLVGIGAVALLFPAPSRSGWMGKVPAPGGRRVSGIASMPRRAISPAGMALLTVAVAAVVGLVQPDATFGATSPSRAWNSGQTTAAQLGLATNIVSMARQVPARPGVVTLVLSGDPMASYFRTVYLATYQRSMRSLDIQMLLGILHITPDQVVAAAETHGERIHLIVIDDGGTAFARLVSQQQPGLVVAVEAPTKKAGD